MSSPLPTGRADARQDAFALLVVERIGHGRRHEAGATALAVIPRLASSFATALVMPIIAALEANRSPGGIAGDADDRSDRDDAAERASSSAWPQRASDETRFEVDPDHLLELLVLHAHQQIVRVTPALLTRMSSFPPSASTARGTSWSTAAPSERLHGSARDRRRVGAEL